jgi:hypothetical protein
LFLLRLQGFVPSGHGLSGRELWNVRHFVVTLDIGFGSHHKVALGSG